MKTCMRTRIHLSVASALFALSLLLAPAQPARSASTGRIVHCMTHDGGSLYTDGTCAAAGARPAPMSGALVTRLVDEAHVARDQGLDVALPFGMDPGAPTPTAPPRRPAAAGCARSPQQLAVDLRSALALGDVNRVAESYHWTGMHSREGQRTLTRLAHLLGRPAVDTQYYAAQIASLSDDDARGGDGGILQLVLAGRDAPSVVEFDVHRYAGCYFVRFPGNGATIA